MRRVVEVDVDDQHVPGIGFDVIEVGHLRRTGVPHRTALADRGAGVLVPQCHIVHRATIQCGRHTRHPDQGRVVWVRRENIYRAMGDQDPRRAVGRQVVEDGRGQIRGGPFGAPRGGDDLHPRCDIPHPGAVEDGDVVRTLRNEFGADVHRGGVQRIVITGQQVDGNTDPAHCLQRLADHLRRELVVLEDVAGHDHELRPGLGDHAGQCGHGVAAGSGVPRLGLPLEEMPCHAELPVGRVDKAHVASSRCSGSSWCKTDSW